MCWPDYGKYEESYEESIWKACGIAFGYYDARVLLVAFEDTELENNVLWLAGSTLGGHLWSRKNFLAFSDDGKICLRKSGRRDSFGKDECLHFSVSGLFISNI